MEKRRRVEEGSTSGESEGSCRNFLVAKIGYAIGSGARKLIVNGADF